MFVGSNGKRSKRVHFCAFRAKLSLNGVHAYGALGMDESEGQRRLGICFEDEETSLRQRR